jgi:5-methyltetrahydropteroyltriglutamate--homocysteine methyltransferase
LLCGERADGDFRDGCAAAQAYTWRVKRSVDRILTTHVGSLVRPPELLESPAGEQREAVLRQSVADVVRHQADVGIDVPSDGEYGKSGWFLYLTERTSGFESREAEPPPIGVMGRERAERFVEYYDEQIAAGGVITPTAFSRRLVATGPIRYTDTGRALLQRDLLNFKAALANAGLDEGFLPLIAPASVFPSHGNEYYASEEEYLFGLADALHEEYQMVVDAGLILQVDDAILLNMHDSVVAAGQDYRRWMKLRLDALNHALRGIAEDRVRYHLCWGSWHGPHTSDVPLRDIVDLVLTVNAGAYSIEAANPRHEHEWVVWQDVKLPAGKVLIPGMVTHHSATVEHPELVAQRIVRFASVVGRENLIAGSDCGFAQSQGIRRQHPSIMWAKLEALAEGARLASGRLFN